ncbi:hypothetical protein TNCV_167521 [Trichonephila clavipes]|nr:hypothetical protein TNCV_167521 [Trichonephila clavipes]
MRVKRKFAQFCVTVKHRTEVPLSIPSMCLEQMQKEEKSFVKEGKKRKTSRKSSRKSTYHQVVLSQPITFIRKVLVLYTHTPEAAAVIGFNDDTKPLI